MIFSEACIAPIAVQQKYNYRSEISVWNSYGINTKNVGYHRWYLLARFWVWRRRRHLKFVVKRKTNVGNNKYVYQKYEEDNND